MAREEGKEEVPQASDTVVPTAFSAQLMLPPGGRATLNVQADLDLVLQSFAAQATGPALVRIKIGVGKDCNSETPTIRIPGDTFSEFLDHELPGHLAVLAEEDLTELAATNQQLLQGAEAGDDEAFFKLLSRDPRHIGSEITLRRVLTWRTQIEDYQRRFLFKASRFWMTAAEAAQAKQRMEAAQSNLLRFGQCQLAQTPILLFSSPEELCFLIGSPAFALLEFLEVQALRAGLGC